MGRTEGNMKITILGSTGMLGYAVGQYFTVKYGEKDVCLSHRGRVVPYSKNVFYFDALKFLNLLRNKQFKFPKSDYIINCIGLIKQHKDWDTHDGLILNSLFPLILSDHCKNNNSKLINISTDCVFSGKDGNYTEEALHDALDEYGKTKSLGESCKKKSMLIRTSIIGEELHNNVSLVSWVKSQNGKRINGYSNHIWNGVTTLQYAKLCSKIIDEDLYREGLYHVFSNSVNKYELVSMIVNHFNLNITVDAFKTKMPCNRSLSTIKEINNKLNVPLIQKQIDNM